MATKGEGTIAAALIRLGYHPVGIGWLGGRQGWVIRFRFIDRPDEYVGSLRAPSLRAALAAVAALGPNTAR